MGQTRKKYAVCGKLNRPELGMGLHEKSILIQGQLEYLGQGFIFPGDNGRCQNHQIRIDRYIPAKDMILKRYRYAIS